MSEICEMKHPPHNESAVEIRIVSNKQYTHPLVERINLELELSIIC